MSILSELAIGLIEAGAAALQRQIEQHAKRAVQAVNRRLGPVNAGRGPIDTKLDAAKKRAEQTRLHEDEIEPAMSSIDDSGAMSASDDIYDE